MADRFEDMLMNVRSKVSGAIETALGLEKSGIPKEASERDDAQQKNVAAFAKELWEDARRYFEQEFEHSKDTRFNRAKAENFWEACRRLEAGNHWEVWGRRNTEPGTEWKQEFTDNVIGDDIRARVAYLTSNWHNVTISPNVQYWDEVFRQERKATAWTDKITHSVKEILRYGEHWAVSYFDKTYPGGGVATEEMCRPGSVLLTPYATGLSKSEGCNYAVHAKMVPEVWVRENYPGLKIETLARSEGKLFAITPDEKNTDKEFRHTKMLDKIVVYMDDPALEQKPFSEDEFNARAAALAGYEEVNPQESDNHPKWIKAWGEWIEERVKFAVKLSSEDKLEVTDEQFLEFLVQAVNEQIDGHIEFRDKLPYKGAKVQKYPNGRHICVIGGRLAYDGPSPYEFDWRKLFHKLYNEKVPGRIDGRGDVEIGWTTNKAIDQAGSRYQDSLLFSTYQPPWLKQSEKAEIQKEGGYSLDPTKPKFFKELPPTFPTPRPAEGELRMYQLLRGIKERSQGISDITYGKAPTSTASGDLADTLLSQNEVIVTGEANTNLNAFIEEIVETRLLIWRQFYTEPRVYTINGKQTLMNVSEMLSNISVDVVEGGQVVGQQVVKYPTFEVSVKPDSNFPQRWERELQLLLTMGEKLAATDPEGAMSVMLLVMDMIGEKFPGLARGGQYRQDSQDLLLGRQIRQRREELLAQQQKTVQDVAAGVQRTKVKEHLAGLKSRGVPVNGDVV